MQVLQYFKVKWIQNNTLKTFLSRHKTKTVPFQKVINAVLYNEHVEKYIWMKTSLSSLLWRNKNEKLQDAGHSGITAM